MKNLQTNKVIESKEIPLIPSFNFNGCDHFGKEINKNTSNNSTKSYDIVKQTLIKTSTTNQNNKYPVINPIPVSSTDINHLNKPNEMIKPITTPTINTNNKYQTINKITISTNSNKLNGPNKIIKPTTIPNINTNNKHQVTNTIEGLQTNNNPKNENYSYSDYHSYYDMIIDTKIGFITPSQIFSYNTNKILSLIHELIPKFPITQQVYSENRYWMKKEFLACLLIATIHIYRKESYCTCYHLRKTLKLLLHMPDSRLVQHISPYRCNKDILITLIKSTIQSYSA